MTTDLPFGTVALLPKAGKPLLQLLTVNQSPLAEPVN